MDKVEQERALLASWSARAKERVRERLQLETACPVCKRTPLRTVLWGVMLYHEAVCPACPEPRWTTVGIICVADPSDEPFVYEHGPPLTPDDKDRIGQADAAYLKERPGGVKVWCSEGFDPIMQIPGG